MKHLLSASAALVLLASSASAQIGLPVVDTWRPLGDGVISTAVGYSSGDDVSFYGIRGNYGVTDYMDLFLDVGIGDVDEADSGVGFQLGTILGLPFDLICPLGIRVGIYASDVDGATVSGVNAALTTGMEFQSVPGLTAGFAIGFADTEFEVDADPVDIQEKSTDPYFSIGGAYNVSERMALWLELTHVDDSFVALGGSYAF